MKCDFKTLPLILYQIYNVIVSLSLFVVVYTISHRNPSRHFVENRNLLSWMKHQRKLMNSGKLKED